ncbi:cyclase family protein [Candidatus Saccharibacteria bacterium]|nr:cyclase family protein [Candidatus Saccharibacteria bacterium]
MELVDLSVVINEDTPVYPGDPKVKIRPLGVFEKDSYNDHLITIPNHVGTHIDAPWHMVANGKTLDQIPIDQFVGRGRLIQVENKKFDLAAVKKAKIRQGDIVLFRTGMSDVYHKSEYFNYPEMPPEIANYLVGAKVKMVGVDMISPDKQPYKIHRILLSADVLIIENLTNLEQLVGKEFTIYALPIKLQLDGAPARVIAQIDD